MTVPVPVALPATSGWALFDWIDRPFTQDAPAAGGTMTITLPQVPESDRWLLTHMVCACTSPNPASTAAPQMRLYLNTVSDLSLRDGTRTGDFDVADWPATLMVPPGASLIAVFTGVDDGTTGNLTVQGQIMRRTS